mmetsp:Transcript_24834/g.49838  ORF Transcript_24834/g.49838 Transcript_24834/m.49838 type:complete len:203 (+) Transcript_24834:3133-3741(+)
MVAVSRVGVRRTTSGTSTFAASCQLLTARAVATTEAAPTAASFSTSVVWEVPTVTAPCSSTLSPTGASVARICTLLHATSITDSRQSSTLATPSMFGSSYAPRPSRCSHTRRFHAMSWGSLYRHQARLRRRRPWFHRNRQRPPARHYRLRKPHSLPRGHPTTTSTIQLQVSDPTQAEVAVCSMAHPRGILHLAVLTTRAGWR